jgi:hypothetical protein
VAEVWNCAVKPDIVVAKITATLAPAPAPPAAKAAALTQVPSVGGAGADAGDGLRASAVPAMPVASDSGNVSGQEITTGKNVGATPDTGAGAADADGPAGYITSLELICADERGHLPDWPLDVSTLRYLAEQPSGGASTFTPSFERKQVIERVPTVAPGNWSRA